MPLSASEVHPEPVQFLETLALDPHDTSSSTALPLASAELIAELEAADQGDADAWSKLLRRAEAGVRGAITRDGVSQTWLVSFTRLAEKHDHFAKANEMSASLNRRLAWLMPSKESSRVYVHQAMLQAYDRGHHSWLQYAQRHLQHHGVEDEKTIFTTST